MAYLLPAVQVRVIYRLLLTNPSTKTTDIYHSIVGGAFGLNVFPAFLLHGGLRMNLDFTFAF